MQNYHEILKNAAAYKLTGQTRIYLDDGAEKPWAQATSVEGGGMYRMDMCISYFIIATIDGLEFRWSLDLEDRSSNGKGYFEIDDKACLNAIGLLPPAPRKQLQVLFAEAAAKVQAKAREWQGYADRQKRDADTLYQLSRA